MAPKTHFTVPLNKGANPAAPTQGGRRTTRTTEKIPLDTQPKCSSRSLHQVTKDNQTTEDVEVEDPSKETGETYPLQDADDMEDMSEGNPPLHVS
jgi:hypothetical protein